ncbi:HAMP domain-containing sensor histidine kinase [uncultured Sanguibacteroides sp.]|uniref:sensor histidine kinase n=1 Tax=uncultured Sanguibacteroides sp. TaxID=1635151 RepID=UPI0025F06284|nr:HAMP domain-containing sensor histidine kinase [uncultured Sanguibacteroides sp.]
MIKKIIIRILTVVMLVAFIAVVGVQWFWIKYSMRESEIRFSSKVHAALEQVVNTIDDINNVRYLTEITEHMKRIEEESKEMIPWDSTNMDRENFTAFSFITQVWEYGSKSSNRSATFVIETPGEIPPHNLPQRRYLNQDLLEQSIKTLGFGIQDTTSNLSQQALYKRLEDIMLKLIKEKDPENVSVEKRLEVVDIERLLRMTLDAKDIRLPFKYEIIRKKELKQKVVRDDLKKNFYCTDLFPKDWIVKDAILGITLESADSLIYENIGWMLIASAFCIFGLMGVFIFTIVVLTRQQKVSVIKNDFINNMTHEFKTPLATISLATSAIEKEKVLNDKNQLLKFNTMIRKENDRMNKYVERILLQAKLDRREIHLNKVEVDLNILVDEAVQHFRLQVEERGGEIKEELDPEGFVMEADEVHMLNVVCNLLDNAIKYSYDSLNIYIFTRRVDGHFIIGVLDSGIGIPKESQKKVFKRFYRVPSGNLHNVKGFGLGLSYVKSIVELHNGTIRLTSKKNKGTLVEIIFKIE